MTTANLFPPPVSGPIARDRDPVTSQLAAREVKESGMEDTQCEEVLAALRLSIQQTGDGVTSRELAALFSIDRYTVARRLPTLRERGLVTTDGMRKCGISGRMAIVWKARA